ncbi:methylenetetrahydrofolate reductase [Georgenia satyanarayanai]|uniref:methylenetetrahydrofolate reductase n=1 Tax=Georgenia satyanarayanai TaxID=860221 RepID=UPI0020421C8A|nr:methylenetetrahydrofolate reductase [Georgenia satyanarayanai]MCM3661233.1 methylenetetrahydrofolate reductase [Georgenia satyanarayanai]
MPRGRPTVSFELYPPRTPASEAAAWETVERLAAAAPDFFSVTYGASGSTRDSSRALVRRILAETSVAPIAHLTCVGSTRAELTQFVDELLDDGVRDFLALRGDPPDGQPTWVPQPEGVNTTAELVALIRAAELARFGTTGVLSVAVAAYPAGASHTRTQDVVALRDKQAAGADFAITQVFYDVTAYVELVEEARAAGVVLPLVAGIIPMTDPRRLRRLAELTGVPVPEALLDRLTSAADDEERHRIGIDATLALVEDVVSAGAPGLHLFTFNQYRPALDVVERLRRPLSTTSPRTIS